MPNRSSSVHCDPATALVVKVPVWEVEEAPEGAKEWPPVSPTQLYWPSLKEFCPFLLLSETRTLKAPHGLNRILKAPHGLNRTFPGGVSEGNSSPSEAARSHVPLSVVPWLQQKLFLFIFTSYRPWELLLGDLAANSNVGRGSSGAYMLQFKKHSLVLLKCKQFTLRCVL